MFGAWVWLSVTLARAELRSGATEAAWEVMQPVLREAHESREILGLLLCGAQNLDELARGRWPDSADPSLVAVLQRCAAEALRLRTPKTGSFQGAQRDTALTERELQIVQLVTQGRSNKLIARELGLSPHTVKRHMARVFEKTGHLSRGRLASWYRSLAAEDVRQ